MIRSSLASGTPSIPSDSNSGLRSITNSRSGSDSVIVNGPVPGGGCCVMFAKRRVGRHRGGEREREQVIEGRVRALEPDRDPPRPVVGLDSLDVGLRLAALLILDRTDDPLVQERAGRAEVQDPPQRVLEVARLDGPAVRVHEALAETQAVGRSVGGDLRKVLSQARDQGGPRRPFDPLVGEQRRIDLTEYRVARDLETDRRVELSGCAK